MKVQYTATRKELTDRLNIALKQGFTCFRIRHVCNCRPTPKHPEQFYKSNQRNGILIIQGNTVKNVFVKCKICHAVQITNQHVEIEKIQTDSLP